MNASDEKEVRSNRDLARVERERELNDLRLIAATPEGRRFFRRMFGMGHIEQDVFTGNSATFYNLGMRQFALKYWNDLKEADLDAFTAVITEGK